MDHRHRDVLPWEWNPSFSCAASGADLTNDQWDAVIEILSKPAELIPFLDIALSKGFGAGMEEGCLRYSRHCQRWITHSGEQFVLENFLPFTASASADFCYV